MGTICYSTDRSARLYQGRIRRPPTSQRDSMSYGPDMAVSRESKWNYIGLSSRGYYRLLWIASFAAWVFISFADAASLYAVARSAAQPTIRSEERRVGKE